MKHNSLLLTIPFLIIFVIAFNFITADIEHTPVQPTEILIEARVGLDAGNHVIRTIRIGGTSRWIIVRSNYDPYGYLSHRHPGITADQLQPVHLHYLRQPNAVIRKNLKTKKK